MSAIMVTARRPVLNKARQGATPPRGILGLPGRMPFAVRRWPPPADLAWCIERFWVSAVGPAAGTFHVTRILPPPVRQRDPRGRGACGLTADRAGVVVAAPERTTRSGRSSVKFTAGAFHLLTDVPVASISGAGQSARGVLPGAVALELDLRAAADDDEQAAVAADYVRARCVEPTPTLELDAEAAVDLLVNDGRVRRVADAGDRGRREPARAAAAVRRVRRRRPAGCCAGTGAAAERVIQLAGGAEESLAWWATKFGYGPGALQPRLPPSARLAAPSNWARSLLSEGADLSVHLGSGWVASGYEPRVDANNT